MLTCQSRSSGNPKRGGGNESVPGQQMRDCTVDKEWVITAGDGSWDAMTLMGINMYSIK